jgi:pSer/pThr/pTyr-binding forkhead associated (FHA) protein
MWRVEVTEVGRTPLPPIDIEVDELLIGSGEGCQLRLPARSVHPHHLRLRRLGERPLRMAWSAGHALELDGLPRQPGSSGEAVESMLVVIGNYRLQISEAGTSSIPTSPQRTESLVRELIRNIMGGAAPRLVVEVGPAIGSSRTLAPPDSRLTVGRGDEADWVILDEELSRVHAVLVRTWDGVRVLDLGSKNGTTVDGVAVPATGGETEVESPPGLELRHGARITFGDVIVRYDDEAETYLSGLEPSDDGAGAGAVAGVGVEPGRASRAPGSRGSRPPTAPALGSRGSRPPTSPETHAATLPAATVPSPVPATVPPAPASASTGGSLLLIGIGLGVAVVAIAAALWLLGSG